MKLLLDMYRSAPKEQRDKVQLMAAEKKSKAEVTELSVICHSGDNLHMWSCLCTFIFNASVQRSNFVHLFKDCLWIWWYTPLISTQKGEAS